MAHEKKAADIFPVEDAVFEKENGGTANIESDTLLDSSQADLVPPKRPRKKRSVKKMVFWGICILIAGVILFNFIFNAVRGPAPVYVETQVVQSGDILQTLSTTGAVTSGEKVTVFGAVSAPITAVNIEVGSVVNEGSTMFTYDTTDLERSLRTATASRGIAGLQAQAALDASKQSEQSVADTQASIDNLKIQLQIAQQRLAEANAAYAAQYATTGPQIESLQIQLDALRNTLNPTPAQVQQMEDLQQQINILEAQLKPYATAVTIAQEDVNYQAQLLGQMQTANQQAKAGVLDENAIKQLQYQGVASEVAYEAARANLDKGKNGVQAPISGVVTSLSLEKGALSNQYAPMCVIESISKVNVVISLSRYDLERVVVGQQATVNILGQEYAAQLSKINRMATTTATSSFVAATVTVNNPDGNIFLGVEANVDIATGRVNNVLKVSISAVNTDVDGTYCFVMEDGVARRRDIVVGMSSETEVQIVSGLSEGEEIILSSQNIADGMPVTIDPAYKTVANGTGFGFAIG